MERELKRGTLELVLLQMLAEGDSYGYELASEATRRSGGAFQLKEGTLYPVLYRLESAGHVQPYWETKDRGVPRKYYRITETGVEELGRLKEEWQAFVFTMQTLLGAGAEDEERERVRIGGR